MKLTYGVTWGHMGYKYGGSTKDWIKEKPNSAGGVSIKGLFRCSDTTKTIKYITIYFTPYNRVNDAVTCTAKRVSEYGMKCTGPYEPGKREFLCVKICGIITQSLM